MNSTEAPLSDRCKPISLPPRVIQRLAAAYGVATTSFDTAMMQIPNGRKALIAFTWMDRIFKLIGDVQPNKAEIHLETMRIIHRIMCISYVTRIFSTAGPLQ